MLLSPLCYTRAWHWTPVPRVELPKRHRLSTLTLIQATVMSASFSHFNVPIPTLQAPHTHEIDVTKSRFISWIARCKTPDDAHRLLKLARAAYPDARHHCAAFIAGPPGEQIAIGFSDDGEPGGTAGRPMFQALEGSGLGEVGCVVIRYFGGIKLGTGGLVRAYTKAVLQALTTLPIKTHTVRCRRTLRVDFSDEHAARRWCEHLGAQIDQVAYGAEGVQLILAWPAGVTLDIAALSRQLKSAAILLEH